MLGNFTRNAWYVRGSPRKDVSVGAEEVGERAFLFGGKRGANAHLSAQKHRHAASRKDLLEGARLEIRLASTQD